MKVWDHVRSFGLGGLLCGGLSGLLFIVYPDALPPHATIHDVLLVGGFLGAACQRLLAGIFKPLHFYPLLLQLTLLRPAIGERTYKEILRKLTLRYFLGEKHEEIDAGDEKEKPPALPSEKEKPPALPSKPEQEEKPERED